MAVYRRHGEGAWSGLNAVAKTEKWLIVLEYLIRNSFDLQVREGILSQLDSCRDSILAILLNGRKRDAFSEKICHLF